MAFQIEKKENEFVFTFTGRLDTTTAQSITQQVQEITPELKDMNTTIDVTQLEYISSSGIRLLLLIRKASCKQVTLQGVRPEIMQILKVTKLDTMFTIV